MGLDFGTMNGFQGDFRGFYSNPLSFSGSTLPGPPINLNSTFAPGTFGSELIAPSSFGYDLASSSYPSDDMLPDFSFTNMLNGPWDFSGIDLNAIKLPVSEERSTSPRNALHRLCLIPPKHQNFPFLLCLKACPRRQQCLSHRQPNRHHLQPLVLDQSLPSSCMVLRDMLSDQCLRNQLTLGKLHCRQLEIPGCKRPSLKRRPPPQSFACQSVCQSNPSAMRSRMPLEQITWHSWVPTKRQDSRLLVVAWPSGWAIEAAEERKSTLNYSMENTNTYIRTQETKTK